ncbi:polysaccharide deacetylase family protein [Actinoplanes sp. DH11]|uniref:polysaccharide deacetylase family protein n=1 Tax=Actinoplanes sp. DH11 TaxID=2857011 RepID=UPI001E5B1603|nr:polysaccharide deacetylase family protein [Actinoplanes sp. DH11]
MTALLGQAAAAQTTARPAPTPAPPVVAQAAVPVPQSSSPPSTPSDPPSSPADRSSSPSDRSSSPSALPESADTATPPGSRTERAGADKRHVRVNGPAHSITTTGSTGVALTFDDGPDPTYTPQLLEMLAKAKVKATFCVVGTNAKRHPQLIRDIVKAGHTLCNHSWNHDLKLGKKPPAKIKADLERTNAAIRAAVPDAKIPVMRAPGGNFTPRLVKVSGKLGMKSLYWQVDPRDWEHPKGESHHDHRKKIIRIVKKHTRPGAVILSHDYAQPDTIAAYQVLLPWLKHHFELIAL